MKSFLCKRALRVSIAACLLAFGASCGNTIYGLGLDMERAGRKLQRNRGADPAYPANPTDGGYYSAPSGQTPSYGY